LNFQSDFATVVPPADLDRDGLPDSWEYRLMDMDGAGALRQIGDVLPDDDFDDDRASNYSEYIADTDPAAASSGLRLTSFSRSNQVVRLQWVGGIQATQYLERSTSLNPGSQWVTILTNHPLTSVTNQFTDSAGGTSANRFYRIKVAR
jgi:hypothetical protein